MAPSAETRMTEGRAPVKAGPPDKNLALAVNYEVALVDQFLADTRKRKRKDSETDSSNPIEESRTLNSVPIIEDKDLEKKPEAMGPSQEVSGNGINRRMSMRDRGKREANLARNRIRYDFQLVPTVRRNSAFLNGYTRWWMSRQSETQPVANSTSGENGSDVENKEPDAMQIERPFHDDSTVMWIPSKRSDWEDCVSEMTSVCTQAAIRRHPPGAPFVQPLSREYIRDRIDIDDPQLGYQLRHRRGGWLQGFILFTNFTTWNLGFRWDSRHPASGIPASNGILVDRSGTLSVELASQPHAGDTNAGGVVFPTVAEISLLGGLGCGEYLLRMALDDIRSRGQHNFVVLQATTMSRPFYEKFGFVRVGAICYFRQQKDDTVPLVGYRHWTHANESQKSLDKHGGPSYMMCLKLSGNSPPRSFLDRMLELKVENKPFIETLGSGTGSTPATKSAKKVAHIEACASNDSMTTTPASTITKKKKPGPKVGWRKNVLKSPPTVSKKESVKKGKKRRSSTMSSDEPTPKRTKTGRPRGRPPGSKSKPKTNTVASRTPKSTAAKKKKTPKSTPSRTTTSSVDKSRAYHSVRGPDGRFIRVLMDENHQLPETPIVKRKRGRPPGSKNREKDVVEAPSPSKNRLSFLSSTVPGKPMAIDPKRLKKQRVMSYPRDRPHFYNKVVRHKTGRKRSKFYFVLEYDETKNLMCLVPMAATGTLSGQRNGRPRYTCTILSDDSNFEILPPDGFEQIPATMIMKTPFVASEAWDIEI